MPATMSNSQREKLAKNKASGCNDLIVKVLTSSPPEDVVSCAASPYSVAGATSSSGPSAAAMANNPQLAAVMENLRRANPNLYSNLQGGNGRGGPDRGTNLNPSQRQAMEAAMSRR